jgi:hypothetical protein
MAISRVSHERLAVSRYMLGRAHLDLIVLRLLVARNGSHMCPLGRFQLQVIEDLWVPSEPEHSPETGFL